MNCFLKIGETDVSDLVAGLKLSYQTLFGNEATNAQGRRVMDVIEGKRVSLTCTTKPLTQEEMERLLGGGGHPGGVRHLPGQPNEDHGGGAYPHTARMPHHFVQRHARRSRNSTGCWTKTTSAISRWS